MLPVSVCLHPRITDESDERRDEHCDAQDCACDDESLNVGHEGRVNRSTIAPYASITSPFKKENLTYPEGQVDSMLD